MGKMLISVSTELGMALVAARAAEAVSSDQPDHAPNVIGGGNTRIVDVGGGTPYEGTGRDTTVVPLNDGDVVDLPMLTSKNFRTAVGAIVGLRIEIPEGQHALMDFSAGIGEYEDAGNAVFDVALSREPLQIEGAPARDPKNVIVSFSANTDHLFSPGTWYVNVRCNQSSAGQPTQGWTIRCVGPRSPV